MDIDIAWLFIWQIWRGPVTYFSTKSLSKSAGVCDHHTAVMSSDKNTEGSANVLVNSLKCLTIWDNIQLQFNQFLYT